MSDDVVSKRTIDNNNKLLFSVSFLLSATSDFLYATALPVVRKRDFCTQLLNTREITEKIRSGIRSLQRFKVISTRGVHALEVDNSFYDRGQS